MKILQISPQFPYPLDSGGRIGIYNITKFLKENGAELITVAFSRFPIPSEYLKELSKICTPFVIYQPKQNSIFRAFGNFLLSNPALPYKFWTKKALQQLDEIIRTINFDIIHVDHSALMKIGTWIKERTDKPLGLRLHNVEWIIWYRYFLEELKLSPKMLFYKQQYKLLREFEKNAISNADILFTCTEEDKRRTLELVPNANIEIVSPGVDLNYWICQDNITRNPKEIVFATTFSWKANVDGLFWFLNEVFPYIRARNSDVTLTIIGKNPPTALAKYKGVNVLGWVEKVQPYYNRANISICPLFVGGGIRVKILEAMAMELPVVSTSIGAEGIDAPNEKGLFVTDDPKEFAEIVNNLLGDFDLVRKLGQKARKYIIEKHSSIITFKIIFDSYKRITEERKNGNLHDN